MAEGPKIGDQIRCVGGPQEGRLITYNGSEVIQLPCRSAGETVPGVFDRYRLARQGTEWVYATMQEHA